MIDVLDRVKQTIEKHKLITEGDRILVALSGGADSVCLLHVLCTLSKEYGFSVCAAHVNHGLRGAESDGDETFVCDLCKQLEIPLYVTREDVKGYAELYDMSVELAGREVRYAYFNDLLCQYGLSKIATAHHADDNIETVLMRLMRGTGVAGLAGIPYQNGAVIRPLLDVSRKEVEAYITEQKLSYRSDSSNESTEFTRNRIRHDLLPLIESEFNPNFRQNFASQIRLYAQCAAYLDGKVAKLRERLEETLSVGVCYDCDALLKEDSFLVSSLYHEVIESLSEEKETGLLAVRAVEEIVAKKQGKVTLSKCLVAEICHGKLYIRREEGAPMPYFCELTEAEESFSVTYHVAVPEKPAKYELYLDAEKLAGKKLIIRSRKAGDAFYPVGMEGKKTIQDFFVDNKVPRFLRDSIPLLVADEDIIWVAGMRADKRYLASVGDKNALRVIYDRGTKI